MKAKDLVLKVVNQTDDGKFKFLEFSPCMDNEKLVKYILADAEILRPTGEKDINGKEIYEGDIVEFITERYHDNNKILYPKVFRSEVIYSDGGFVITENNHLDTWLAAMTQGKDILIEVIGNKFENPELIG